MTFKRLGFPSSQECGEGPDRKVPQTAGVHEPHFTLADRHFRFPDLALERLNLISANLSAKSRFPVFLQFRKKKKVISFF